MMARDDDNPGVPPPAIAAGWAAAPMPEVPLDAMRIEPDAPPPQAPPESPPIAVGLADESQAGYAERFDIAGETTARTLAVKHGFADFVVKPVVGVGSRDVARYSRSDLIAAHGHLERLLEAGLLIALYFVREIRVTPTPNAAISAAYACGVTSRVPDDSWRM